MPNLIEVKDLSKFYKNSYALRNVSLTVKKGEICGIIGRSGAGKSTLLRSLALLVKPTSGSIFFQGEDISQLEGENLRSFRRKIGMIFQHFNLLQSRTVSQNIAYPLEIAGVSKEEIKERVKELLELVNLTEKKESYPSQLSGGEKQRVGIARALAARPEVLLSDEGTSALDPKSTKEILALLKKLNEKLGLTIILITHEMEVIKQICTHVVVLDRGEVVEKGLISQVVAEPKHPTSKQLFQHFLHEACSHFLKENCSPQRILRLRFNGKVAQEPIIAQMSRQFRVDSNILLGWIENIQGFTIGTLIIEPIGNPQDIEKSLQFLQERGVYCEEITCER